MLTQIQWLPNQYHKRYMNSRNLIKPMILSISNCLTISHLNWLATCFSSTVTSTIDFSSRLWERVFCWSLSFHPKHWLVSEWAAISETNQDFRNLKSFQPKISNHRFCWFNHPTIGPHLQPFNFALRFAFSAPQRAPRQIGRGGLCPSKGPGTAICWAFKR